jgi:hypothetical protein
MATTYTKKEAVRYILNQEFKFLYMKVKCLDFLMPEDETDRWSGNVGMELPLYAAQHP